MEQAGNKSGGNGGKPGPEAPDLEAEAREIRREKLSPRGIRRGDSGMITPVRGSRLKRVLFVITSLAAVSGAVLLLAFPGFRTGIVRQIAEVFAEDPENRLYSLPAPPPRDPNVTERYQAPADVDDDAILYSGPEPPEKIEPLGEEESEMATLPRSPGSREAFSFMEQDEGLVGSLLRGEIADLEFRDWNLISQTPPVYLLDIVAAAPGEELEQHLIFSVDMAKEEISAMSQAARDFMRR